MARTQSFWTYQVTNDSLTIDESLGLGVVSIMLTSGTASVSGSVNVGDYPSQNLALSIGLPITFGGVSPVPIDGLTIDASSGTVYLIGR